jgi:alanine racemase
MRLRILVVVLLLGNLGYFAWTRGGLAVFGLTPARFSETEPERLRQQVRPQLLQLGKDEALGASR